MMRVSCSELCQSTNFLNGPRISDYLLVLCTCMHDSKITVLEVRRLLKTHQPADDRGAWFSTIHFTFCISSWRVSLPQARITTADHVNMIKNYRKKTLLT